MIKRTNRAVVVTRQEMLNMAKELSKHIVYYKKADIKRIEKFMGEPAPRKMGCCMYLCSWDALMPVVEKIESLNTDYLVRIGKNQCNIGIYNGGGMGESVNDIVPMGYVSGSKIQAVYETVVRFIKWYNKAHK